MLTVSDRIAQRWDAIVKAEIESLKEIVSHGFAIPDIEAYRRYTGTIAGLRQALDLWESAKDDVVKER